MGLFAMLKGEEPNPIERLLNYHDTGQYGEYATEYALGKNNIPGYRKTAHNVYLPYKGYTTELDIVMVHEKGIFVFESKNYSGWILEVQTSRNGRSACKMEKHICFIIRSNRMLRIVRRSRHFWTYRIHIFFIHCFSERCELKKYLRIQHNLPLCGGPICSNGCGGIWIAW